MIRYKYKTFEKYGFKYIDTSQYSYSMEYFTLGDLELISSRVNNNISIRCKTDKLTEYFFNKNSTDDELDNILKTYLRKKKLKQLKNKLWQDLKAE